jgi:DNA (cytosine-5)-methyltransferase 1
MPRNLSGKTGQDDPLNPQLALFLSHQDGKLQTWDSIAVYREDAKEACCPLSEGGFDVTKWPAISLFSGAGGLDLGLEAAGRGRLDFRAWVEIDRDARATLAANRPILNGHPGLFSDITETTPQELLAAAKLDRGETFLLAGGPPCQAFSTAGLRQTVNSPEGSVVRNYFEMVKFIQPRFFVFENVRGLLSAALKHRPLTERTHPREVPDDELARLGSVMTLLILPTFKRLGYEVIYGILNSADYGTAQVRHRVFLIGSRDRELGAGVFRKQTSRPLTPFDLVPPTHHKYAPYEPIQLWRTLKDGIAEYAAAPTLIEATYTYSPERAAIFAKIPPGENWKYVRDNPASFPRGYLKRIMAGAYESGGGKEGYWRRLSWDRPAPTLTAQPQQLSTSLCHPDYERPLSIPEYLALQDFPPDYKVIGSKSSKYRQIGNAVPVSLATAVGRAIMAVAERPDSLRKATT